MADRPDAYIRKDPGDIIRSGDWNELQIKAREEIRGHKHTGKEDGTQIPRAGIEARAIDGSLIDPAADITVNSLTTNTNLTVKGDLTINGKAILGDIQDLLATVKSLDNDKVNRAGDTVNGVLNLKNDLQISGKLALGIAQAQAKLHVVNTPQDAGGNTLILGNVDSSNLRLGYNTEYSWVQSHGAKPLSINAIGNNVGIGLTTPIAKLDVAQVARTGTTHPISIKGLYVTGDFGEADGAEFRHTNGTQGIGLGFNAIYAAGSNPNQDLQLKPKGTGVLRVLGVANVTNGNGYAVARNYMSSGSLTIGSISTSYGGGRDWSSNTAGLLLETLANTEIAVHDSGQRITSLMYYEGDAINRISIGRDMGYGVAPVTIASSLTVNDVITPSAGKSEQKGIMFPKDAFGGGGDAAWMRYYARAGEDCTLEIGTSNDPQDHIALMPSGNVGIGLVDPKAKLVVVGEFIRKVKMATGTGPNDETDNGQIVSRVLTFTKYHPDTAIRIFYCDNLRVTGDNQASRWEIRVDGQSAPGGGIYQDKYGSTGNFHAPTTILGYAQGVTAGNHTIGIWVAPAPGYPACNAYTGWNNSRWTLEAQEVWL